MKLIPRTIAVAVFLACCVSTGLAQSSADTQSQPQASHSEMAQVPASALTGMVEHKTLPQYPKEAMLKGIQGDVVFKVVVDESGKIVRSEPVKGDALLVAASKDALQDYRFHPYLLNGTPVPFESEVGYHFTLTHNGDATHGERGVHDIDSLTVLAIERVDLAYGFADL